MNVAHAWIDVLNTGTGLAGFALFLMFSWLAKRATRRQEKWMLPIFVIAALISILGGLLISFEPGESEGNVNVKVGQTVVGCSNTVVTRINTKKDENKGDSTK